MRACKTPWCVALARMDGVYCVVHAARSPSLRPKAWNDEGDTIAGRMCDTCEGTGECSACDGDGMHMCDRCDDEHDCKACDGTGDCPECGDVDENRARHRSKTEVDEDRREREYLQWALEGPLHVSTLDDLIAWSNGGEPLAGVEART